MQEDQNNVQESSDVAAYAEVRPGVAYGRH